MNRGFTLIEKLLVLLTIVLLVTVLIPIYLSARNKSAEMRCRANLHNIFVWYSLQQSPPSASDIRQFIRKEKLACPRGREYNVPDYQTDLPGDFRANRNILVWCPNHPHESVQMFQGQWGVIELSEEKPPLFLALTREGKVGYYPILVKKEASTSR